MIDVAQLVQVHFYVKQKQYIATSLCMFPVVMSEKEGKCGLFSCLAR